MQRLNNCFEYTIFHLSTILFCFPKRPFHWLQVDDRWIDFLSFKIKDECNVFTSLDLKAKLKTPECLPDFLFPFQATGQWITQISLIRWGPNTALTCFLISIYTQAYYPTLGTSSKKYVWVTFTTSILPMTIPNNPQSTNKDRVWICV